ncbi:hypothetical protein Q670_03230 [Alcanivorax sp. P2S70]|nr:hypothetical protein Q670_03230 [Alcanivorax sp. P2S70]
MALNPVRVAIAETPEGFDYSSIQQRSQSLGSETKDKRNPG